MKSSDPDAADVRVRQTRTVEHDVRIGIRRRDLSLLVDAVAHRGRHLTPLPSVTARNICRSRNRPRPDDQSPVDRTASKSQPGISRDRSAAAPSRLRRPAHGKDAAAAPADDAGERIGSLARLDIALRLEDEHRRGVTQMPRRCVQRQLDLEIAWQYRMIPKRTSHSQHLSGCRCCQHRAGERPRLQSCGDRHFVLLARMLCRAVCAAVVYVLNTFRIASHCLALIAARSAPAPAARLASPPRAVPAGPRQDVPPLPPVFRGSAASIQPLFFKSFRFLDSVVLSSAKRSPIAA